MTIRTTRIIRPLFAAAVLAAALPIVLFTVRTGWAAWLVFPPPFLSPVAPTDDVRLLDRAERLAPKQPAYPFYTAQAYQRRMLANWLNDSASEHGRKAAAAAERAVRLQPANPYFHLLAGAIGLDQAALPSTPVAGRERLTADALAQFRQAAGLLRVSPLLYEYMGVQMVRRWNVLPPEGQLFAQQALLHAAELRTRSLRTTLPAVWLIESEEGDLSLLRAVTPETTDARFELAEFLKNEAGKERGRRDQLADRLTEAAAAAYLEASTLADLDLRSLEQWALAYQLAHRSSPDSFVTATLDLVRRYPDRPEPWIFATRAYGDAGLPEESLEAAKRAVELARDSSNQVKSWALREKADASFHYGMDDDALIEYRGLAEITSSDPYPWLQMGLVYQRIGDTGEAIESFQRAVRLAPSSGAARHALAMAYSEHGEHLDAIDQWRAILAQDPQNLAATVEIARSYSRLGLADEALRYYSRALELAPENQEVRAEATRLLREPQFPAA